MNTCDHSHQGDFEVRLLPIGGDANVIVCRRHYAKEMTFRRGRIAEGIPFDLPEWKSLKIYNPL